MEVSVIVIVILFSIVFSNVLHNIFPRLPLTLTQIAIGCLLRFMLNMELKLEPKIFMIFVIAPLLFREAEETNLFSFWSVKRPVFMMAFGLVFVTVFVLGISVSCLIPTIPLAACFALGAILGPTDVVAVSSLSSRIKINRNLMNILMGEGLINDASGIVAFKFALMALLTSQFSVMDASLKLIYVSVGGVLIGFILSIIEMSITNALKRASIESTATNTLIELSMPFISYVVAESFGMSGVIAVVVTGSRQSLNLNKTDIFEADLDISKRTLWDILTFTLNSMVFLLLGLQLPDIVTQIWGNPTYSHVFLILTTILVMLILMAVRFLGVLFIMRDMAVSDNREKLKNAMLLTLSGAKGTVSLSTAFALPFFYNNGAAFSERPLLLFITAGVIILSLVSASLLLPIFADSSRAGETEKDPQIKILKEVISQLIEREREVSGIIIANYQKRLQKLEYAKLEGSEKSAMRSLQKILCSAEIGELRKHCQSGEVNIQTYWNYWVLLSHIYRLATKRNIFGKVSWFDQVKWTFSRHFWRSVKRMRARKRGEIQNLFAELRTMFLQNTELVEKILANCGDFPKKLVTILREERQYFAEQMLQIFNEHTDYAHWLHDDEMLKGYYVERRVINQFLEQGKITIAQSNKYRMNVNKLESLTLSRSTNDVMPKLISLAFLRERT
ncbi:sodium:proton antiporter [Clostridia bacterium]|nr:sodium:proton antiporter [Clostridia bacterium]